MNSRDAHIDTLRGIAIFTMIAANWAAAILAAPHPLWLRAYGSFAAPLFIFVAGMMVVLTRHDFKHFLYRGGYLIMVGVAVDLLVWQIYPFLSIGVLYLIGLSLPISFLFSKLPRLLQWFIVVAVFLVTPIAQNWLGYTIYPTTIYLTGQKALEFYHQTPIWQHWLVDGWFPILPWLGYALLGVCVAQQHWPKQWIGLSGLCFLLIGLIWLQLFSNPFFTRGIFSELFYPPTVDYIALSLSVIAFLHSGLSKLTWLQTLGRHSLLIYVLHLAVGQYVLSSFLRTVTVDRFVLVYAVGVALIGATCWILDEKKNQIL